MKSMPVALLAVATLFVLSSCASSKVEQVVEKVLREKPELVFDAIEKNPQKFIASVQKASQEARRVSMAEQESKEKTDQEEEYKNPKKPQISDDRALRGKKDAPITLVMYSDFQCPFCSRGYQSVEEVGKKYGDKVRMIYKHLPLDFHPLAMPAAKRFEAIAMQSAEKAYRYHDEVFKNQGELGSKGEKFLDEVAKKVGANLKKMKTDMESELVKKHIAEDQAEAQSFGFSGTPSFLVNGISVRGAQPPSAFEAIIDKSLRNLAGK